MENGRIKKRGEANKNPGKMRIGFVLDSEQKNVSNNQLALCFHVMIRIFCI
jgi:hypothetical protein